MYSYDKKNLRDGLHFVYSNAWRSNHFANEHMTHSHTLHIFCWGQFRSAY